MSTETAPAAQPSPAAEPEATFDSIERHHSDDVREVEIRHRVRDPYGFDRVRIIGKISSGRSGAHPFAPPTVQLIENDHGLYPSFTRAEWEHVKAHVDQAFDVFAERFEARRCDDEGHDFQWDEAAQINRCTRCTGKGNDIRGGFTHADAELLQCMPGKHHRIVVQPPEPEPFCEHCHVSVGEAAGKRLYELRSLGVTFDKHAITWFDGSHVVVREGSPGSGRFG